MLTVLFGLIRAIILVIKGIVEFAFVGQTYICPLYGQNSICEYNFPLNGRFILLFDAQLAEVCCHRIPDPARSLRVMEAACTCCTQTGSGWSHLAIAAHLYSWDPETSVSPCMLCQAPYRVLAPRTCKRLHPQHWILHTQAAHGGTR